MYGETFYGRHTAQHQLQMSIVYQDKDEVERIKKEKYFYVLNTDKNIAFSASRSRKGTIHQTTPTTVVYRTVASNGTCDSVRRVIAYLAFGFQAGHLFILFFYCFLL